MTRPKEERLERLIDRLPGRLRDFTRWARRPSSRWARIPLGVFLILGGILSILPVFGLWMLPLGVILLGEDIAALRRLRDGLLDLLERLRPHWFVEQKASHQSSEPTRGAG
jgi:hypothetical protein